MLRTIEYKLHHEDAINAENTLICFKHGDEIRLKTGYWEGKPGVTLVTPFNSIYHLGEYSSIEEAEKAHELFKSQLQEGYMMHIKDRNNIELIPPKKY